MKQYRSQLDFWFVRFCPYHCIEKKLAQCMALIETVVVHTVDHIFQMMSQTWLAACDVYSQLSGRNTNAGPERAAEVKPIKSSASS